MVKIMGESYQNKSLDTIKQDIKNEFKKIEGNKRGWYRDDQEIYEAGQHVISKYIRQLSSADGIRVSNEQWGLKDNNATLIKSENLYRGEALKYFEEAKINFDKRWNEVIKERGILGMCITSSADNDKQINEVANAINNAEEIALKKIKEVCNPKQEQHNIIENTRTKKDVKGNAKVHNGEIVRQKPLFDQSTDGTITFTDRTNPLRINEAIGDLFKNKDIVYKIDYSACKNEKIKKRMQNVIGGLSCWIKYDSKTKTYVLTDKSLNIISYRALVWEGVTLKQSTFMENAPQSIGGKGKGMTKEEISALEQISTSSESFKFNIDDYRYYEQYSTNHKANICSAYAYGVVSDILASKGYCFSVPEVNAWNISSSSYMQGKFSINTLKSDTPKQQIIDAPAGSILTVKYDESSQQNHGVTHAMVSLGNGVYTDLFGPKIRKFDFKSHVKFSGNKFTFLGKSYSLTKDSRLMSPQLNSFPTGKKKTIQGTDLTPDEFANSVHQTTGANMNYIKCLIAKQNNIPEGNFGKKFKNLSINIITKSITNLNLQNKEGSNDIANNFLESIKQNKEAIMGYYPNLTNHEYDEIAKRAVGILYQESNAGRFKKDNGEISRGSRKEIGHSIVNGLLQGSATGITTNTAAGYYRSTPIPSEIENISVSSFFNLSRGYTQIKFNEMFNGEDKAFLKSLEINGDNDLADARKCGIATMVGLIRKYYGYIVPMKSDPFRINDAKITQVKYNDGHVEEFARERKLNIRRTTDQGVITERRRRTDQEFYDAKIAFCKKHGNIKSENEFIRPGIKNPDNFFDFLYYAWNQPSQIRYGTATPDIEGTYAYKANEHIDRHLA